MFAFVSFTTIFVGNKMDRVNKFEGEAQRVPNGNKAVYATVSVAYGRAGSLMQV